MSRNFAAEVHREGGLVGQVKAQVSTRQILRNVFSRTQRKRGEIPFAMDSEGKLYAAEPAALPKIEALPIPGTTTQAGRGPKVPGCGSFERARLSIMPKGTIR